MILFLDFDGVLHPEPCYRQEDLLCRLPLLEQVLRDFPGVEIVISSTWRDTRSLTELQSLFSGDIALRIIDVTPSWRNLPELSEHIGPTYLRQVEIEGWLRQAERVWEPWVALDDRAYWFKPFLKNLVACNPSEGLADVAITLLRAKFGEAV